MQQATAASLPRSGSSKGSKGGRVVRAEITSTQERVIGLSIPASVVDEVATVVRTSMKNEAQAK